jgi:AcrR family transcriptional regulator
MSVEDRRAALADAALRVLARDGVAGTTTRAIVAEAGMPLGAFHYCYPSKDALLRELAGVVVTQEFQSASAALQPGADLENSVRNGLQYWFDFIESTPQHQEVLMELAQYSRRVEALRGLDLQQYQIYWGSAEEGIRVFGRASNVEWTLPVPTLARLLVAVLDGITTGWLADRDSKAARAALDAFADYVLTLARPLP